MKGWKLFIPLLILAIVAITLYLRLYNPPLLLQGEVDTTNVIVASKAKGRVQVLHVRRGDDFRQGDLLISLDSPELEAQLEILRAARNEAQAQLNESLHGTREENIRVLQASLAQAQAELRNAEQNFQRNRQILDRGFLSRTQFDLPRRERDMALNRVAAAKANLDESLKGDRKERRQALQAAVRRADAQLAELQAQLDDLQVRAPVDGEVGPIPAEQGELVNAYSPLLTLVRLNDSYFVFNLREDILAKVRKGDHITLKIPGLGGSQVEVKLRYIAPLGDFSTKRATRATGDFDLKTFEVRFYPIQPAGTYGVGRTEAMLWVVLKRNGNRFLQTFSTETRIACRSWTIHWLGWCWPLLLFGLISGIYQAGTLLDMPVAVAVVDKDHSALSRRLIRELDAISHAQVIEIPDGMPAALGAIRRADAYALLYIPPDFEADVFGGRVPKAELYYNALLYAAGYAATQDFSALVADFNGELRLQLAAGMPALPHLTNISVSYDSLFNASGNYIYYQQFAAIVHLLQLFVIVTMVHVLAREAPELRTSSPHILRAQALGVRLLGKLAPYTLLFSTLLMLQIFLLVVFSGAKINGSPLWMLMITFFYVIAAQSIGLILFVFTANRFTAYSLIGMLISIAQTYSGVLIPELAMPALAQVIAEAEPLTHTLHGLFDQFLRQAPDNSALYTCAKLALYPLIAYTIAKQRLRSRLDLSPI